MNFIYSYFTDKGIVKNTNQDSLLVEKGQVGEDLFHLFLVCDGMGGLQNGEVASAELVHAFAQWFRQELPGLWMNYPVEQRSMVIESNLRNLLENENRKIAIYGKRRGISLGSTISVMLTANDEYYIAHVGDSRIYELANNQLVQMTKDHTLVARDIELGLLRPEDAEKDSRRNVLLQCIGASDSIEPQFLTGMLKQDAVYFLCSDGFRHELAEQEILHYFAPQMLLTSQQIADSCAQLCNIAMSRGEQDNITVLAVRSYKEGN